MDFDRIVSILKAVFSDSRLLLVVAAVVLYLNFVVWVSKYRKKPKIIRRRKIVKPAPEKQPAQMDQENEDDFSGNEDESAD